MEVEIIEQIDVAEFVIRLRADGIIQITYKKGTVIDVELQERSILLYHQLCKGVDRPFLFEAMEGVTVTKEGRENSIVMEPRVPAIAYAVVADSLPYKLVATIYMKINKPQKSYKVFSNKKDAVEWLKSFL